MKPTVAGATILVLAAISAYSWNESQLRANQVADYEAYVSRLLDQVEQNSQEKLRLQQLVDNQSRELANAQRLAASVQQQLADAELRADPGFEEYQEQLREELIQEILADGSVSAFVYEDRSDREILFEQIARLQPEELGEIMQINARFGNFLAALNVSQERKLDIMYGLSAMIAEQNQARIAALEEARSDPDGFSRRAVREAMVAINSPEAEEEALSYLLDDDEMRTFKAVREQQQQTGGLTSNTATFIGGRGPGGPIRFENRALRLVNPDQPSRGQ